MLTEQQTDIVVKETSGGFVSPNQQTIADTRARIRADMRRHRQCRGFVAGTAKFTSDQRDWNCLFCDELANQA